MEENTSEKKIIKMNFDYFFEWYLTNYMGGLFRYIPGIITIIILLFCTSFIDGPIDKPIEVFYFVSAIPLLAGAFIGLYRVIRYYLKRKFYWELEIDDNQIIINKNNKSNLIKKEDLIDKNLEPKEFLLLRIHYSSKKILFFNIVYNNNGNKKIIQLPFYGELDCIVNNRDVHKELQFIEEDEKREIEELFNK